MIVLGVNGKLDGHDPAAALVVDGRLAAAVEEERLCRVKHAPTRCRTTRSPGVWPRNRHDA
ncbi:MAG TPA: hypothetical protein VFS21_00510 [Roseiflexaceae bacterium]|nr:hypothetical protein [Roseiflexaceae bacterium]